MPEKITKAAQKTVKPLLAKNLSAELRALADDKEAENLSRFFKTGKGQYGEGDFFLGIKVPVTRKICRPYRDMHVDEITSLLKSKYHEERLASALLLVEKYKHGDDDEKMFIYKFYMDNARRFNNWDLVDLSAPFIAGDFLFDEDRTILFEFARSQNLWERRISIVSTHTFIRRGDICSTFLLSDILLSDSHDLIHKAVGWMLRETGKVNSAELKRYLKDRLSEMPRTALRYAIEKFPEKERQDFLKGRL